MSNTLERRRLLQLAGTGAAATVAGCSELSLGSDDASGFTVSIQPDPDAIRELQDQVEDEEITPEEAAQEEQELIQEAIDDFEELVDSTSDDELVIEDEVEDQGLYLIEGSDEVIIDAVRSSDIPELASGGYFELIAELAEQQPAQPPAEGQPPEGGEEMPDGGEMPEDEEPPDDEEVVEIDPEDLEGE